MNRNTITIEIGGEDWHFLASVAKVLELSPTDAIAAFWKIGASAYVAQALGFALPPDLIAWTPDSFVFLWKLWLAQQSI